MIVACEWRKNREKEDNTPYKKRDKRNGSGKRKPTIAATYRGDRRRGRIKDTQKTNIKERKRREKGRNNFI